MTGAINVHSNNVFISNSELTNNRADIGGVIFVCLGSVSISNSELTNNRADIGGAIFVCLGSVSISNSELTNNSHGYGGAIDVFSDIVSISDSKLTNNIGGVFLVFLSSTLIINNTAITNNIGSLNISQSNVTFTGINIVSNNSRSIYTFNGRIELMDLQHSVTIAVCLVEPSTLTRVKYTLTQME